MAAVPRNRRCRACTSRPSGAAVRTTRWGFSFVTRGVGLALVGKRGYGRRRWLVHPSRDRNYLTENRRNPVALPQLTDEQRAAALEKAAAARRARAELKDRLKRGGTNLKQVLTDAETDEVLGKMKVSALLEALPKVGKVKAQEIMTELEIAPTRRLRGLGDRQRKALLEKFDFS
ncbi:integration host factor [Mycolicibacterium mucogenicum DSM 44124]|nr:integration host factor [Mycolicibacterium mucogenicum DSM 44124]